MDLVKIVLGFALGALVTFFLKRLDTARNLLTEGMEISALDEAWILEGADYDKFGLTVYKKALNRPAVSGFSLKQVEIRAILDEASWNLDEGANHLYGFIEGRRTWIVRDRALEES
jgi:hypothetical protein